MQEFNRDFSSFTLNYVSLRILGKQKIDLNHKLIKPYFDGSIEERTKIATYCDTDTSLPLDIIDKTRILTSLIEMTRCTRVTLGMGYTRGQQIKVYTQVAHKTMQSGYIIESSDREKMTKRDDDTSGCKYKGATVITPDAGYYDCTIVTLDFSSLYPSIMQARNTCFRTYIHPQRLSRFQKGQYEVSPVGHAFLLPPRLFKEDAAVKLGLQKNTQYGLDPSGNAYFTANTIVAKHIAESLGLKMDEDFSPTIDDPERVVILPVKRFGILPTILAELVAARKRAKAELKTEKSEEKRAIIDKRQLALKICANSVYGTTGVSQGGKLSLQPIAEAVTSYGRDAIDFTKNTVESEFTIDKGYPGDAHVLYGGLC